MRIAIITHGGAADHINLQGLIRYYSSIINKDDTLVVMSQGNCVGLLHALYEDLDNIEIYTNKDMYPELIFHDQALLQMSHSISLIRVGYYLYEYNRFAEMSKYSFIESFYLSKNLDPSMRYTNFVIPQSIKEESMVLYNDFIKKHGKDYILIHEDPGHKIINDLEYLDVRGNIVKLDRKYITNNLPIINLDLISDKMIDYYDIVLNAKEIHITNSSWGCLIHLLNFNEEKLKNTPVYMHYYARECKNEKIYENPKHPNWIFI